MNESTPGFYDSHKFDSVNSVRHCAIISLASHRPEIADAVNGWHRPKPQNASASRVHPTQVGSTEPRRCRASSSQLSYSEGPHKRTFLPDN